MSADPVNLGDARRRKDATSGRVPPHNLAAEESLLGSMLITRDAILAAIESQITPEDFYKPAHARVFEAVIGLYGRGEPSDLVTVDEELRRTGNAEAGGPSLVTLQANTPAPSSARRYAHIILEHSTLRRLVHVAREMENLGHSMPSDVQGAIDAAEQMVFDLRPRSEVPAAHPLVDVLGEWLTVIERRVANGGRIEHPMGWHELDRDLGGLHPGRLVVVAARPGMGKTSWSGALAVNVARQGEPVLYFSIEMGRDELAGRMVASAAGLVGSDVSRGEVTIRDWERISSAMAPLGALPLDIVDTTPVTLLSVRTGIRRAVARFGTLGLVVIDYLQLMSGRGRAENRQVEVAELARGLKLMSKEMDVPIVVLAQLNRSLEARADKRPNLADLRESGEIENSADQVVFIYRDEHYNPQTEDKSIAELIISKNRHGPTGTVQILADMARGRWLNLARADH